jgi:pimeloyl-ACP methyl ester carboxylesterase
MVGYGASIPQGRDRDISVARQAEHLVGWLKHLGIDSAVLAGHDLGGGVAQIVAVRNRGLCAGLFLTNAIGYDSWPDRLGRRRPVSEGVLRGALAGWLADSSKARQPRSPSDHHTASQRRDAPPHSYRRTLKDAT